MILIDTSVWISFFKGEEKAIFLQEYIIKNKIVLHPYVYGELLLGGLSRKSMDLMKSLPFCSIINFEIIYEFIYQNKLQSSGVGWVDMNIIVSAKSDNFKISTFDSNLNKLCTKFNCML